jgi:plastocyanin
MRYLRTAATVLVLGVVLAACGGGDATTPSETGGGVTTTAGGGSTTTAGGGGTTLTITAPSDAANAGFAEKTLSAPADTPLTIAFQNDDAGIPHNVQIFEGTDTTADPVFAPVDEAQVTGVATATYEVPALAAGTYTYNCYSHPATMVGTLTVA